MFSLSTELFRNDQQAIIIVMSKTRPKNVIGLIRNHIKPYKLDVLIMT